MNVLITAEIDQIIESSYRAIMFEPVDTYTLMNYRNMLSSAISQLKNDGTIKAYSIDVQITPGKDDRIEGWVSFTPPNTVDEIILNFKFGDILSIKSHDYKFDQAMQGI